MYLAGMAWPGRGAVLRVPDDPTRHAVLNEVDGLFRHAFVVECGRNGVQGGPVVPDRDVLAHNLFTDAAGHEAALIDVSLGAEGEVSEVVEDIGDGVFFEDDVVFARIELLRVGAAAAFLDRLRSHRRAVNLGGVERHSG